jgi:hypothetical protein
MVATTVMIVVFGSQGYRKVPEPVGGLKSYTNIIRPYSHVYRAVFIFNNLKKGVLNEITSPSNYTTI